MTTNELFFQCVEKFLKINNELNQIQKRTISITNEVSISTSALHLIETIGNYPYSTITDLADKLGVTKGSISQQIPKLLEQGLIQVNQTEKNKKNKYLCLTMKGIEISEAHNSLHKDLYKSLKQDLETFSPQQIVLILEMLNKISLSIDRYQHE